MRVEDAQQLLVRCLLFILTLYTKNNVNLMLLLADAQSSKSEDSEDESYAASIASSVSLGSQDTEIEDGEVDDLAIDAATMPTPKPVRKKSPVPSAAPITATAPVKKIEAVSTTELASAFGNLSVQALSPFFDFRCPYVPYHHKKDNKHIIWFDVHAPALPKHFLRYARVLPGGQELAWLFGFPKWWSDEITLKKQMGSSWDKNSNRVQARAQQVTHYVAKKYPSRDEWIEGTPQIVRLPFKCVEGDVTITWGLWPTNMPVVGKMKQYLPTVTMMVTSVDDYAGGKEEEEVFVYDSDDESSNHQSFDNEMNDL